LEEEAQEQEAQEEVVVDTEVEVVVDTQEEDVEAAVASPWEFLPRPHSAFRTHRVC